MTEQVWTITRPQLIDALAAIELHPVLLPGRGTGTVVAEDMADAILSELPPAARIFTEWAVAWGGEDPNDCAGRLVCDDEAEAVEYVPSIRTSYVARREVTRGRWERAPAVGTGAPDAQSAADGPRHAETGHDKARPGKSPHGGAQGRLEATP